MSLCGPLINYGFITRLITTGVTLVILQTYFRSHPYLYILLAAILLLFDGLDNLWTKFHKNNICSRTFYYQNTDKVNDLISYALVYSLFPVGDLFLPFLVIRAIGVLLFTLTQNAIWLILMPDLLKEYLIYLYVFKSNTTYIPLLILGKIGFEYYYHTIHNKRVY